MAGSSDILCLIVGANSASKLQRTFKSIQQATYTRGKVEICYVDLGSHDDSLAIAEKAEGVHTILLPAHSSLGEARAVALTQHTSPLIQILQPGSEVASDWFQLATRSLLPDVVAMRGKQMRSHSPGNRYQQMMWLEEGAPPGPIDSLGNEYLLRISALEKVGGFGELIRGAEDLDLARRLVEIGKMERISALMTRAESHLWGFGDYWVENYQEGLQIGAASRHHRRDRVLGKWKRELWVRGGFPLICLLLFVLFAPLALVWVLILFPGVFFLLQPRIFQVEELARSYHLSIEQGALLAWHRSISAIPRFLGMVLGWLKGGGRAPQH